MIESMNLSTENSCPNCGYRHPLTLHKEEKSFKGANYGRYSYKYVIISPIYYSCPNCNSLYIPYTLKKVKEVE